MTDRARPGARLEHGAWSTDAILRRHRWCFTRPCHRQGMIVVAARGRSSVVAADKKGLSVMSDGSAESVPDGRATSPPSSPRPGVTGVDEHHEKLLELQTPLRRFVASRVRETHHVDDIVQETMLRMLQVAPRLEHDSLSAYAFTVARNLIVAGARSEVTAQRNLPRLVERREPVRPDTAATDAEARRALGAALAKVTPSVRLQLLARDLDRRPLHEVAGESNVSPGVLASQLHRARAKLRVDYLLALRQITLPSATCQKVLVAISAADQRRQTSLQAGQHLAGCPVCSELSLPLVGHDHALAGWAPIPVIALGSVHGHLARLFKAHPRASVAATTAAAVTVAAVAAAAVYASHGTADAPTGVIAGPSQTHTAPTPTNRPSPTASGSSASAGTDGSRLAPVPGLSHRGGPVIPDAAHLKQLSGQNIRARDVTVLDVPADEGFWIGQEKARVWVNLTGAGESPVHIRDGQRVSFTGVVTANTPAFLVTDGPAQDKSSETLKAQQFHLKVDASSIKVT